MPWSDRTLLGWIYFTDIHWYNFWLNDSKYLKHGLPTQLLTELLQYVHQCIKAYFLTSEKIQFLLCLHFIQGLFKHFLRCPWKVRMCLISLWSWEKFNLIQAISSYFLRHTRVSTFQLAFTWQKKIWKQIELPSNIQLVVNFNYFSCFVNRHPVPENF